jgi:protein-S-isoprenylcysteine O-methyltransferase Ste14
MPQSNFANQVHVAGTQSSPISFLTRHRIGIWRIIVLGLVAVLCVTQPLWQSYWVSSAMDFAAIVLISLATVGRLWCALYVSGRKGSSLVKEGPYSMCRHPLYFCNFLGVVGLGASSGSLVIMMALAIAFSVLYPGVIRSEERWMGTKFLDYADYASRTPAFFPRPSLYQSPASWEVDVSAYLRNCADSIWFPLLTIVVKAIELAHVIGLLPIWYLLP